MYLHPFDPEAEEGYTDMPARAALARLRKGNAEFLDSHLNTGDISSQLVQHLFEQGQSPFAIIITCADSRVAPEHIFMTGLGELFVIRVAGNVIGEMELASVVYAAAHLHTRLVLVMGHTHCGAIEAAMQGGDHGTVGAITNHIAQVIGNERDQYIASLMNVRNSMKELEENAELQELKKDGLLIKGAICHIHSGIVDFLEEDN